GPAADQPGRPDQFGEACRPEARLAACRPRPVWRDGGQDVQDLPGDVAPRGGVIRVVLVREPHGWAAFFCTDPAATVADILAAVADRFALEQCFRDLKAVWGAGQQQVRNLWACIGAFHLNLWLHTLTELWAWDRPARRLAAA